MNFKKVLIWALCFQMSFGHSAYAFDDDDGGGDDRPGFDFTDEPFVVTPGGDRYEGRDDGNCTGSGCGEREGRGERGDDRDDENSERGSYGSGDRGDSRGDRGNQRERGWIPYGVPARSDRVFEVAPRQIASKDDRVDGMIFLRDTQGLHYFRGEYDGEYTDHRDIYFNRKGVPYVKSVDGKLLLNVDGLMECSNSGSCVAKGYREDWWNYSLKPDFDNWPDLAEWEQNVSHHEDNLEIKQKIAALREKGVQQGSSKERVLNEIEFLAAEAKVAFQEGKTYESFGLQDGARNLLKVIADVGISLSPAGWAKDAYELVSGRSPIDGHTLSTTERFFAGIGTISPALGPLGYAGMRMISRTGRVASEANFFSKLGKLVENTAVRTPQNIVKQEFSRAALEVKAIILAENPRVYRIGTRGINMTGKEAQYWALEHPINPSYGGRYGMPQGNFEKADFIEVGRVKSGTSFVTRRAPGVGKNVGGEIEVVVPEGAVTIEGHYSL